MEVPDIIAWAGSVSLVLIGWILFDIRGNKRTVAEQILHVGHRIETLSERIAHRGGSWSRRGPAGDRLALPVALLSLLKGLIAFGVPGTEPGASLVPVTPEPELPAGDEAPAPDWPKPPGHVET